MWNSFMSSFAASKQRYCLSNVPLFSSAGYCNKIGKLMLARLLTTHDAMMSYDKTPETCKTVHSEEVKELCSDLMTLDPPHSQYYKDEYSFVVLKQRLQARKNLSNNKMGSFSALEPLKLLKSLKVLDISYNEISAHAVDTRSGVNVTNYWEAFAIFKDSKLTQLDNIGNVVAEEEFKLFLVKILRALNWLDGVELH
ncbi:unnamed protein product [Camellia sinensis]